MANSKLKCQKTRKSSERQSESSERAPPDTCACALPHHKLVVDVHSGGSGGFSVSGGRCREHGKHTTDRVAAGAGRCHTEADRQLATATATQHRNDQLDNCDRSGFSEDHANINNTKMVYRYIYK